jgi:hypothetical protein
MFGGNGKAKPHSVEKNGVLKKNINFNQNAF